MKLKRCFSLNNLKTSLANLILKNPLIAASGIVGYGQQFSKLVKLNNFGAISIKGTTLKPRLGNLPPRITETNGGMLNSVGLENPGIDTFIQNHLPWLLTQNTKIIANIADSTITK